MLLSQPSFYILAGTDVEGAARKSSPRMPWCQRSNMVLSDSRDEPNFEALGFQTSLRCTTPTHSQRPLVSDLQQQWRHVLCVFLSHSMIPFAMCAFIYCICFEGHQSTFNEYGQTMPNTLTRSLSWGWNGSAFKVQAISAVSCFTIRKIARSPGSDVCPCHRICSDAMWWTTWPKLRRWKR